MNIERYSRQILYKNIGEDGQQKLLDSTVLIVGVGALGSVSSEMLTRLGIGKLILIDRDYVELSNLQRQTLYTEKDVYDQKPKAIAAYEHLKEIREDLDIEVHVNHVDALFLESLVKEHDVDLILDGTDNFETRLLINDVSYKHEIPWVHAAVIESSYVSAPFTKDSPCYRCIMPVLPSNTLTCDTAGVISPAVHTAVSIQVTTAIQLLVGESFNKHYMTFGDLWSGEHNRIAFDNIKNKDCETCVHENYPSYNDNHQALSLCGRDTVQIYDDNITYDLALQTAKRLGDFKETPYFIEFYYDDYRIVVFKNGRMLIHGLSKEDKARTIVAQLFG